MTSNELKHLSRGELLQLLLLQVEENERLKSELDRVTKQLNSKKLVCDNAGSIAQASLQLNRVFENADRAAQQYIHNIRKMSEQQEKIAREMEMDAQKKADAIIAGAEAYKKASIQQADDYWNEVRGKVRKLMQEQYAKERGV